MFYQTTKHVVFVSLCAICLNQVCQDGQLFQEYCDLISLDFGTPVQTQSDLACLWEQVSEVYKTKGDPVKSGRWFSWQSCCEQQLKEFWTTRMLLMHEKPNGCPDSPKTFIQMRSEFGAAWGWHCNVVLGHAGWELKCFELVAGLYGTSTLKLLLQSRAPNKMLSG